MVRGLVAHWRARHRPNTLLMDLSDCKYFRQNRVCRHAVISRTMSLKNEDLNQVYELMIKARVVLSFFTLHALRLARRSGWLLLALAGTLYANSAKISPDLQPLLANPSGQVSVIIQYSSPLPACSGSAVTSGIVCPGLNLLGGTVNAVFSLINAVAGTVSAGSVAALSDQPGVSYISLNRAVGATLDYSANGVNAPVAWNSGWDGTGIGVAVIDSGIYSHPDLLSAQTGRSRVVYRQSFIGGVQYDDFGHGTHVAGIIAGTGSVSNVPGSSHVLRGIAPNANLVDLRVLDQNGSSNDSAVIAAIQTAVQLKYLYDVRVINLSLGRPIYESCTLDPLCQAAEAAWSDGIVVVIAAGNLGRNGYGTILSPGDSPHSITVGAMKTEETYPRSDDLIASYSSKGPTYIDLTVKPDIVAPGNLVVSLLAPGSTLANAFPENIVGPSYYSATATGPAEYLQLSGTSMATPVVSGTVALMLQKDPTLAPDTVKARLMKTAGKTFPVSSTATDPTTGQTYLSYYDIFTVGAGYLDVAAALGDYEETLLSSVSPTAAYNAATGQGRLVLPLTSNWQWFPQWFPADVWGNTVLPNGNTIWNSSYAWSSSSDWGTNIAWGTSGPSSTNIAWGTSGPSSTNIAWGTSGQGEP
jgi:serine protease AprX